MSLVQGKPPLVQVKEPYGNLDMATCMITSCNLESTLMLVRAPGSIEKERNYW